MRYYWRVFLWENGRRSTEYTDYTNAPIFLEDKLDETLDSGEIILMGMPIATKAAFPPKTKFRLERYNTPTYTDEPKHWDMIVEHDDVEEYAGCPDLCTHRVHLIEASAVAQGMHVDNIALTYELQDVTLNYKTTREDKTIIGDACEDTPGGYSSPVHKEEQIGFGDLTEDVNGITRYFRNSYKYAWDNESLTGQNAIRQLRKRYSGAQVQHIIFKAPELFCYGCYSDGWVRLFEMNVIVRVTEKKLDANGNKLSERTIVMREYGATSFPVKNDIVYYSDGSTVQLRAINDWSETGSSTEVHWDYDDEWATHPVVATAKSSNGNKTIEFDTTQLSDEELSKGYEILYEIVCTANPTNKSGMVEFYEKKFTGYYVMVPFFDGYDINYVYTYTSTASTSQNKIADAAGTTVAASFYCRDLSEDAEGGTFLMKGVKYSCYNLLQKALLTIDTQIIDNAAEGLDGLQERYPIFLHADWVTRLKAAKMQETILEGKNLWEVLLQIGYYLHAIPYFEFADDGTDRFALKFHQLGDMKERADTNNKITIFNSRNLSDYFTQYDSYVTNLFSPQNVVDEWLVPKTSDSSYLVSNNTAELHTSRPILEVIAFDITYNGQTVDALSYIFEESVYQILTSDNPMRIKPAKGNALYYKLGDNKILGLNYVPPQASGGSDYLALQEICRRLFKTDATLKFNDLLFHIRYRTQDELRVSQVRPDLQNFVRNSSYEKYPHHEQYYGQQDKIIDSERFSANLFGQLIRVGNAVYQRQEYVAHGDEKESGDLVMLGNEPYYVTAVENEYYPDVILQKVTYSKNFNQLSKIVTIPSEPRFYEVSERSKIRREVRLMDFLELTTTEPTATAKPRFLNNSTWKSLVKGLIFNKEAFILPNFAYTKYAADYKRIHKGSYGQVVPHDELFPSSEIDRADPNSLLPKAASDSAECITSLLHFPLHDGIVFEWDMEDNFKVGDYLDTELHDDEQLHANAAYFAQQSHRYVDVMGRADLFTFRLFYKNDWTIAQSQRLPMATVIPSEGICAAYLPSPYMIALDKDNREALSFNYQVNLLHRPTESDGEDFITFPNLFGQKESPLKMCFLSESQSLFNENVDLSPALILADNVEYNLIDNDALNAIEVRIPTPTGVDLSEVRSIVLYQEDGDGGRYAYIVKNVDRLPNERKLQSWWIQAVFNA